MTSKLTPTLFANVACELGEGPLWHPQRQSLFWLDISRKKLYEKTFPNSCVDDVQQWDLPLVSSALALSEQTNQLWLLTEHSFGLLDLLTGQYSQCIKLSLDKNFRTNDGGQAPNGDFWFGTMEKNPSGLHGEIYSINCEGVLIKQLSGIGIPNTLCWQNEGQKLLLTDSFRQTMFSYNVEDGYLQSNTEQCFFNLQQTSATPDGGAIDQLGHLWNAHWGGHCVACYNSEGQLLKKISVPVPQPTSCCFGGPDYKHLFITSAYEGMSSEALERYPLSGNVFVVELADPGFYIKPFVLKGSVC